MPDFPRTILADTGFWFALYRQGDEHHAEAVQKEDILERATVLVPWPSLYETINTKFSKNRPWIDRFERFLRGPRAKLVDDKPYREAALKTVLKPFDRRGFSLVDMVIRLILEDDKVSKDGILTFNQGDFADLCRKHHLRLL